jgi:hypothetical protein
MIKINNFNKEDLTEVFACRYLPIELPIIQWDERLSNPMPYINKQAIS